jgi:hypothetical protein
MAEPLEHIEIVPDENNVRSWKVVMTGPVGIRLRLSVLQNSAADIQLERNTLRWGQVYVDL